MPATSSSVLLVSLVCWCAFELCLAARDVVRRKGSLRRDRGTRELVSLSLFGAIALGGLLRNWVPAFDTPAPYGFIAAGAGLIWLGLAVRVWAVVTLGGSFRTSVEVDAEQTVVTRGPYRWVRHPSYTGLLLVALGFGVGIGNWLSVALCAVIPLLGLLPRIAVEESEMVRVLGDQYRDYRTGTYRLVPGIW